MARNVREVADGAGRARHSCTLSRDERGANVEGVMLADFPVFPILLSTDLAKSRAFYGNTLGLQLMSESEERLVFRCGGGTGLLISRSTVGTRDTQTQVAWR